MKKFLHDIITRQGPLPLDHYMALCLSHPQFGYYMTRDPLGAQGDFTTAPEINQIFGELIGIWCMAAWEAIGSPAPFMLVELGPGRGTLMADILRVTSKHVEFASAAQVHLVDMSPTLRAVQKDKIHAPATWHESIASLPEQPMIFIANEFFDALPVRQLVGDKGKLFERHIGVQNEELGIVDVLAPGQALHEGIQESSPISLAIAEDLGARLQALGGAGLAIDYGYLKSATGDTVQALKNHNFVSITQAPGESDLTAHVDFEALAASFAKTGSDALKPMTQGDFLKAMGHGQRLAALAPKLQGKARADFELGANRLIAPAEMGNLFKVLCVAQTTRQPIYPFEAQ